MKLTKNIALATLDEMPNEILADLYEDETNEDASHIRAGKRPSIFNASIFLWHGEQERLSKLSIQNFCKELHNKKLTKDYSKPYVDFLLRALKDQTKRKIVDMIFNYIPLWSGGKLTRKQYQEYLKAYRALNMKTQEKYMKGTYWSVNFSYLS